MATAKALSEVDDLLTCSICLELLTDPHTLQQCFHSYCKDCAATKIERKYDEGRSGVYCPICRTFSSNDEIKSNFFVNDMLEKHAKLQNQIKPKCKQCNSKEATQRCVECKMYLCDPCKDIHLSIPLLQGHDILPFDGIEDMVIDKLMFCSQHNGKAIEFNCKECEILLCIMCKIIGHENHKTETIETALQRLLPKIKENTKKLNRNIQNLDEQIQQIDGKMKEVKTEYNRCHIAIATSAEQLIARIKTAQQKMEDDIKEKELGEQKKLQLMRDNLQRKKDAGHNFSKLVDTCLQKARHTSQLAEIQGGLYSKVEENSKPIDPLKQLDIIFPDYTMNKDLTTLIRQDGFLGNVKYQSRNVIPQRIQFKQRSKVYQMEFNKCLSNNLNRRNVITLPCCAYSMSIINNNIWVCLYHSNKINLYHLDGTFVQSLSFTDKSPISIQQLTEDRLVLACRNTGLYEMTISDEIRQQIATDEEVRQNTAAGKKVTKDIIADKEIKQQIAAGQYSDVSVDGNEMFALEWENKLLQHYSLEFSGTDIKYKLQNTIDLQQHGDVSGMHCYSTVCTDTTHIYVLADNKQVYKFTKSCKFVCTLGEHAGMSYLALCGVDSTGSLLIADCHNKCLKVMDSQGQYKEYNLDQLGEPFYAVIDSHLSVWCVEWKGVYKLVHYSKA